MAIVNLLNLFQVNNVGSDSLYDDSSRPWEVEGHLKTK